MQKNLPLKGVGGAEKSFPNGPGTIFHTSRREFRNILVVSANQFVFACVNEWAEWRRANVRAVQGPEEAETLIRGQGGRIGLLVLDVDPKDAIMLLDLAKRENNQLEAVVMLPPVKKGVVADEATMRRFMGKGAGVIAWGNAPGEDPATDVMFIEKALGLRASGPRTDDVFPVSSPA